MKMLVTSAPGKIFWIGGYSVLERPNVAFITGVNKRVYAKIGEYDKGVRLRSKQFGYDLTGQFDENGKVTLEVETDKVKFVKAGVETALRYVKYKGKKLIGFELETHSDKEFGVEVKAGLGSSAAVTVAVVGAVLSLHGYDSVKEKEMVHKLAQYSHFAAQGKVGSGFDIAAAVMGASLYVRYSPSFVLERPFPQNIDETWDYVLSSVPLPKQFRVATASLNQSASTSEFVKKVNEWKKAFPGEYKALMTEYNAANVKAIDGLKNLSKKYDDETLSEFQKYFNVSRLLKKRLGEKSGAGIETSKHTSLIDESNQNGAFVSCLPGAGGGDAIAAFCLNEEDKKNLTAFWTKKGLTVLELDISNEGIRFDKWPAI